MALRRKDRASRFDMFPGFTEIVEIGVGSLATVFRARESDTGRRVALKLLNVRDASPRAIESFERESVALGSLSSHPNIVTLFRTFRTPDGRPVLVLELCTGAMADRLHGGTGLQVQDAVAIGVKVAGALETAHRGGILHRDVKPQNILMTEFGEPALADFGVAMLQSSTQTTAGLFDFTTLHAAPELLEGGGTSAATDVYELASSLYQLVAGQSAFRAYDGESPASVILRILRDPVRPLMGTGVPVQLSDLLIRAMSKDKDHRPPTAVEFAAELADVEISQGWPRTQFLIRGPAVASSGWVPDITRMPDIVPRTVVPLPVLVEPSVAPPAPNGQPMVVAAPAGASVAPAAAAPAMPAPTADSAPLNPVQLAPWPPLAPSPPPGRPGLYADPTASIGTGWTPPSLHAPAAELPPAPVHEPPARVSEPPTPVQAPPAPVQEPPTPVQAPPAPVQAQPAPVHEPAARVSEPPVGLRPRHAAEPGETNNSFEPLVLAAPVPVSPEPELPAAEPGPVAAAVRTDRTPIDIGDDEAMPFELHRVEGPATQRGSLVIPQPQPAPIPTPQPVPAPEPQPVPAPEPQPVPAPEPQPVPAPEPQPVPAPEPQPVPAPEPQPMPMPVAGSDPAPAPLFEPAPPSFEEPPVLPTPTPALARSWWASVAPCADDATALAGTGEQYPIPPAAPDAAPTPGPSVPTVPTWAVRAPAANFAPSAPQFVGDISIDPHSLRPRLTLRAGLSSMTVDEHTLVLRSMLRRERMPWSQVAGFEPHFPDDDTGPTAKGVLVALTPAGAVELPATRRLAGELRHVHALLDAYRVRAQMYASR